MKELEIVFILYGHLFCLRVDCLFFSFIRCYLLCWSRRAFFSSPPPSCEMRKQGARRSKEGVHHFHPPFLSLQLLLANKLTSPSFAKLLLETTLFPFYYPYIGLHRREKRMERGAKKEEKESREMSVRVNPLTACNPCTQMQYTIQQAIRKCIIIYDESYSLSGSGSKVQPLALSLSPSEEDAHFTCKVNYRHSLGYSLMFRHPREAIQCRRDNPRCIWLHRVNQSSSSTLTHAFHLTPSPHPPNAHPFTSSSFQVYFLFFLFLLEVNMIQSARVNSRRLTHILILILIPILSVTRVTLSSSSPPAL